MNKYKTKEGQQRAQCGIEKFGEMWKERHLVKRNYFDLENNGEKIQRKKKEENERKTLCTHTLANQKH